VRDVVPPEITSINPADGATEIDPLGAIVVQFSEPLDRGSVTGSTLTLAVGGGGVPVAYGFSNGDRTVTMTPVTRPLQLAATFTITATVGIRDTSGNALAAAVTSTFTTKQPDATAPRVASIVPPNNAVDVPIATFIEATFTEPIDPATIDAHSFRVSADGAPVAGQLIVLNDGVTVRFRPAQPLAFSTVVVTELTSAVKDLAGNALVDASGNSLTQPLTFTFLTASFSITSPAGGDDVVEKRPLVLEARASAAANVATVTFEVNGQALAPVAGPVFRTTVDVPAQSDAATLTVVAVGRNASGVEVARDRVTVDVVVGLEIAPTLLGVPHGSSGELRVELSSALVTDLPISLVAGDPGVATLPADPVVLPAGETRVTFRVGGSAAGNTTITATSPRGDDTAIVSVSPPTAATIPIASAAVGAHRLPPVSLGAVFVPPVNGRTVHLQLLAAPAAAPVIVAITTSNAGVARVDEAVTIAAGMQSATIPILTGAEGTAVLTIRAGQDVRQLTVKVGPLPPAETPMAFAPPAGAHALRTPSAGIMFTSVPRSLTLAILSAPRAAETTVTVRSSDATVATVAQPVAVPAGEQTASFTVATGRDGVATLTFEAAGERRELTVVVGAPPPGRVPASTAPVVGVVKQ
jgi:hypothetical protein